MKASELKEMIRTIVAEELKVVLPLVLSEMFVRKIVAEQVSVPVAKERKAVKQVAAKQNLAERLGIEDDYEQDNRQMVKEQTRQLSREQLREKIRKTVLEDDSQNPMAAIYEGVSPIGDETSMQSDIPLEMLGLPQNLERLAGIKSTNDTSNAGPVKETEQMAARRIERQRAQLDAQRV